MKKQKGTLTIKKLEELVSKVYAEEYANYIIKWWQLPLLWMLYPIFGYKETSMDEDLVFYYVQVRGTLYLLKSETK